ncbi:hypothetical protein C351_06768 [Cryptococcus neoformans c8]|nr:hypothetical protein C353_06791 [Cryptococcus neoformans var. grubii AD1-83a]OXG43771.1 hypothetical protein C354_06770 [Cryptococcus neoformans var. grubii MW-RSA1955]OXG47850.1 hypothetical protein C352_06790 [Cryptococcus neoformans var. grubii CHC193]OXG56433.1 hypothetical protein C351_06768 [Cryptococcus neoformans var. grubii c8]OXH01106.1 hypothetical protein C369_06904 [Cryptococcus neoformans var. grubii A5-35-17]OXH10827.1 hypothetical protein C370_03789 [Cryptococcus neoformans 
MDYDPMDQNTCTSYQCCPSFSSWAPFAANFSSAITGKCKSNFTFFTFFTFFTLTLFAFTLSSPSHPPFSCPPSSCPQRSPSSPSQSSSLPLFSRKLTKVMVPHFQFSEHDIVYLNTTMPLARTQWI